MSVSQGRPMSTDDIQKAKMRALFMQSKYGKTGSSKENNEAKIDRLSKPQTNQASIALCSSKVPALLKIEDDKRYLLHPSKTTNRVEASYSKRKMDLKEPFWEKCKRVQIPWKTPAGKFASFLLLLSIHAYNIRIEKFEKLVDSQKE